MNVTFRPSAEGLPRCPLCLCSTGRRTGESTRDRESGGDAGAGLSLRLTPEPRLAKSDRASQPCGPGAAAWPWETSQCLPSCLGTAGHPFGLAPRPEPCACHERHRGTRSSVCPTLPRHRPSSRAGRDAAIKRARHHFGVKMHTLQTMHILKRLELCARLPRSLLTNARQGWANESVRRCGGGRGGGKEIRNCVSFICKEMRPQTSSHRQEEE